MRSSVLKCWREFESGIYYETPYRFTFSYFISLSLIRSATSELSLIRGDSAQVLETRSPRRYRYTPQEMSTYPPFFSGILENDNSSSNREFVGYLIYIYIFYFHCVQINLKIIKIKPKSTNEDCLIRYKIPKFSSGNLLYYFSRPRSLSISFYYQTSSYHMMISESQLFQKFQRVFQQIKAPLLCYQLLSSLSFSV